MFVIVSGKFNIAFFEKKNENRGREKKIVIKRPVIFIIVEGKKRNPTGLN